MSEHAASSDTTHDILMSLMIWVECNGDPIRFMDHDRKVLGVGVDCVAIKTK